MTAQNNWCNVVGLKSPFDQIPQIVSLYLSPLSLLPFFPNQDPSHERAGSNMRYFERLLEKEKEAKAINETSDTIEPTTQGGIYERPQDYLPEREIYEALCRGEGVKMVRERPFQRQI